MNPHPDAKCPNCGGTKPCVTMPACSKLCAEVLGESTEGLPDQNKRTEEQLRTQGIKP